MTSHSKQDGGEGHRTEKDSLGNVEVPEQALYGAQTQRAVQNFPLSGLRFPREFIRALGLVKQACAKVNGELNRLDKEIANSIAKAAAEVASGVYDAEFPLDIFQTGSGTSTNMNANEVIATIASQTLKNAGKQVHPNDHVNCSQSSNDVIPTCIHLSASVQLENFLLPALENLHAQILEKSQQLQPYVKTGRTHLMDAMPVTLGQELSGWAAQLSQDAERLRSCLPRLNSLAIGATAVGTGINAPPAFGSRVAAQLNQLCGTKFTAAENGFAALASQQTSLELSSHLKTLASGLLKICNDLRWMNSGPLAGLGEIQLPELQPGSSIMPGKVNPVIPEAVAMVCAQVTGNDATITLAAQSGNFELNVMLPVIAYNLLQSLELLTNACKVLGDKAIVGFTVNESNLARSVSRNPILVTALNKSIGYAKAAQVAKEAYRQQRPILDVAKELTDLSESELQRLLDPKNLV